ncbi:MAG TPA: MerR family transcriptional regulator [Polyangiales bacterium]|nr:MerR family transcriptional regulator [Polyangiales bacterium]
MKRVDTHWPNVSSNHAAHATHGVHAAAFGEAELADIEARYPDGLSTQEIVEIFAARGEKLSEATFRKYVQQGLLPRSVRVGRKGKHRGSQGRYPASVVRQIEAVRALMAQGFTIQDIQREFLCVRSDIDALARLVSQVLGTLESAVGDRAEKHDDMLSRSLSDARESADALVSKLRTIEQRLAMRARMARAAV